MKAIVRAEYGSPDDLQFKGIENLPVRKVAYHGICVIAGFTTLSRLFQHILLGGWASRGGAQQIGLMPISEPNKKDMLVLKELLASGKIVPVIDRTLSLHEVPEAIRYLEQGYAKGKVVITVEH